MQNKFLVSLYLKKNPGLSQNWEKSGQNVKKTGISKFVP